MFDYPLCPIRLFKDLFYFSDTFVEKTDKIVPSSPLLSDYPRLIQDYPCLFAIIIYPPFNFTLHFIRLI